MENIAYKVCKNYGVKPEIVLSKPRKPVEKKVRVLIASIVNKEFGVPVGRIAVLLNTTPQQVGKYLKQKTNEYEYCRRTITTGY